MSQTYRPMQRLRRRLPRWQRRPRGVRRRAAARRDARGLQRLALDHARIAHDGGPHRGRRHGPRRALHRRPRRRAHARPRPALTRSHRPRPATARKPAHHTPNHQGDPMTTVPVTIPADPDTIAAKSLDDDGWIPYPLGDDVLSGEPNTHANILRAASRPPPSPPPSSPPTHPPSSGTSPTTNPSSCSKATSRSPSTPESASTCTPWTRSPSPPGAPRRARSTSQAASSPSSPAADPTHPHSRNQKPWAIRLDRPNTHRPKRQTARAICRNVRETAARFGKTRTLSQPGARRTPRCR
jgi:hypothetical protein